MAIPAVRSANWSDHTAQALVTANPCALARPVSAPIPIAAIAGVVTIGVRKRYESQGTCNSFLVDEDNVIKIRGK